ncbi:MAG: class I SAM-dependent methyltransferase [Burkholderiaceae bacterium]|nr:class I SAM-dependent methyltransferase [Burkholderiaceae bacterium]
MAEAGETTDFGFQQVDVREKARRVAGVFDSVAARYDLMNDLMSVGLHRLWKAFTVQLAAVRPGMRVLDVAGGTGDLALALAREVGAKGKVGLTDINGAMLRVGRDRTLDAGLLLPVVQCDAEALPFLDASFDIVSVGFGLRNMTRKDRALAEMHRVLRPGGRVLVLEFSRVWAPLAPIYDAYSFHVLPWLGARVAGDADSYRYLAESIRMFPPPQELAMMMQCAGFEDVEWFRLAAGICALHIGRKY